MHSFTLVYMYCILKNVEIFQKNKMILLNEDYIFDEFIYFLKVNIFN